MNQLEQTVGELSKELQLTERQELLDMLNFLSHSERHIYLKAYKSALDYASKLEELNETYLLEKYLP